MTDKLLTVFFIALPGAAHAAAGDHIRVGDTVIAPSVDVGVEARTNPSQANADPTPGAAVTAVPRFALDTEGPEVNFGFGGDWRVRKYVAPSTLRALDRFGDFSAGADLDAFHRRVVGFRLADHATLLSDPNEHLLRGSEDGSLVADRAYYTRFNNRADLDLVVRAGPTLAFEAGGQYTFDDYGVPCFDCETPRIESLNRRNSVGPELDVVWTFFPRSALVLESEYTVNMWQNNLIDASASDEDPFGDTLAIPNSTTLMVQGGFRGRLTERMVVVLMLGYGAGMYDETSAGGEGGAGDVGADATGLDGLQATAQLRYDLSASHKLVTGYQKGFSDSFFTNYVAYHNINASLESAYGRRLGSEVGVLLRPEGYHGEVERNDISVRGAADLLVNLAPWSQLRGGVWLAQRLSSSADQEYMDLNLHVYAHFAY